MCECFSNSFMVFLEDSNMHKFEWSRVREGKGGGPSEGKSEGQKKAFRENTNTGNRPQ